MKPTTPAWIALAAWESLRTALSIAAARQPGAADSPLLGWILVSLASQAFSATALALSSRPGARGRALPAVAATRGLDLLALAWMVASAINPDALPFQGDPLAALRAPLLVAATVAVAADFGAIALARAARGEEGA